MLPTMDAGQVGAFILDRIDFVWGLLVGLVGSVYSWRRRQIELQSKLYYPLFIACYDLVLIFDEIGTMKTNKEWGVELYAAAAKSLDDIMNSYGTAVNLESKPSSPKKDYLKMFFQVKRTVDLNQDLVNENWPEATIWFENAKQRSYTGSDPERLRKIEEFQGLYSKAIGLKQMCEEKGRALKGQKL